MVNLTTSAAPPHLCRRPAFDPQAVRIYGSEMPRLVRMGQNRQGRDFVLGDIHGAYDQVDLALSAARLDPLKDRVFALGDLIDRGRESARCLEFLRRPYVHAIRGNHEDMLLSLYSQGAPSQAVLEHISRSYSMGWWLRTAPALRVEILAALAALPVVIELQTAHGPVGLVHGDVPAGMCWRTFCALIEARNGQATEAALEGRDRIVSGDRSGVANVWRVFVGHTTLKNGPGALGNVFALDTGAIYFTNRADAASFLTMASVVAPAERFVPPEDCEIEGGVLVLQ